MALDDPRRIHHRIGRLRDQFAAQLPPATRDALGERESGTWVEQFKTQGALEALSGLTFTEGQSLNTQFTHVITIRYRAGVRAGMRFVDQRTAAVYDVRSVENVQSKNRWLRLRCVEVPQGATF